MALAGHVSDRIMEIAMTGERDLGRLLRGLDPLLHAEPYWFVSVEPGAVGGLGLEPLGLFREAEGVTLIVARAAAERAGLTAGEDWAWITLQVHSALAAVGMMAAVAGALAAAEISCNPVAGFYHDHLFVPWAARERAVAALRQLSAGA